VRISPNETATAILRIANHPNSEQHRLSQIPQNFINPGLEPNPVIDSYQKVIRSEVATFSAESLAVKLPSWMTDVRNEVVNRSVSAETFVCAKLLAQVALQLAYPDGFHTVNKEDLLVELSKLARGGALQLLARGAGDLGAAARR
jgi:hypothetical protein